MDQTHSIIEPAYPKAGNGRHPYTLEMMLSLHFMQHMGAIKKTIDHTLSLLEV